jgi:hypothetical protein
MIKRTLLSCLTLAAIAATPAVAQAADTVVVPGVAPQVLTALDGTIVWSSGHFPKYTLMQRNPDGTIAAVAGAPTANYRSIDLGHDGNGELVLTYLRCEGNKNCKAVSDDLDGHRSFYRHLVPTRCELTAAPSRWDSRVAYGLDCDRLHGKQHVHDSSRSGLFVRKGAAAAKRLRLPKDARKFGVDHVRYVDLRGTNVGAAVTDIYSYAFAETVNATHLRSTFAAASEGESDENVVGAAVGTGGVMWTLVDASHTGDPNEARISRLGPDCDTYERLINPVGPDEADGYRAEGLAVDGTTLYLYVPATGIVTHEFAPTFICMT